MSTTMKFTRESQEYGRSLGFFDAVYGFALTMLIANIDVPPAAAWADLSTLLSHGVGYQILGFLISFAVIITFWRTNQDLVRRLRGFDGTTLNLNIVRTCLVVFIPFTTQGISDPETTALALPTVLYALNVALAILIQIAMFQVALNHGLSREPVHPRMRTAELLGALVTPAVFLASVPVALLYGGTPGKLTWLSLLVLAPLGELLVRRTERSTGATRPP
ncbi:TMEM175 family protein [Nocardiopsis sp. MG754419]|uniref:TMEM175 family protein n=1 Tax=Nocardiopsis sp. MG754419 TaxID=2259865 RepID=UPI001BADCB60|nr:TMEM175 family protein [Nocardiopsis sp. MG754419]MBR8742151.1 DUF1211 domain-containing protein [Nocardiopsis sp. MG754419]